MCWLLLSYLSNEQKGVCTDTLQGFSSLHPLLIAPGYWSSSAWVRSWELEVGRAKKGNSGPVPFSSYSCRSRSPGGTVQRSHTRPLLQTTFQWESRGKTAQGFPSFNALRIILPSQVSSSRLLYGDEDFEQMWNEGFVFAFAWLEWLIHFLNDA